MAPSRKTFTPPAIRTAGLPHVVRSGVLLACLLTLAAAIFLQVLKGYWLADDFDWVHQFYRYAWRDVPRLFIGDWSRAAAQEYRPLWAVSFITDLSLWGPDPFPLHMTNLGLHLGACILVWCL